MLKFSRVFSSPLFHPFHTIKWQKFDVEIKKSDGSIAFAQKDVEAPASWSQQAVNIVASKYFRGQLGTPDRETSVKQLISRVANTIADWAIKGEYFKGDDVQFGIFWDELVAILVNQVACFNSPVWFNLGAKGRRQAVSACYINSVDDTMESILELGKTEGMLFKDGSGSGANMSALRGSMEPMSSGGNSSGPVSFMRFLDALGGAIKSGGATRRAAIMRVLNDDHPDLLKFIKCKANAEKLAHVLTDAGVKGDFTQEWSPYDTVPFQNANHSVRLTDNFMGSVQDDGEWSTISVKEGEPVERYRARNIMREIASAAWFCGDPGVQFDTTINNWHTSPKSGRINASNPCSEYMFLDDTACNLSSINLMKFRNDDGSFDYVKFKHTVQIMITAMEILVSFAEYPTPKIAKNSEDFRPLGLGYANLGALIMSKGLAYDSDAARALAADITAVMGGEAYAQSARLAEVKGPFNGYAVNKEAFELVIHTHNNWAYDIRCVEAEQAWRNAVELGTQYGFRNSQVTVLAPTGTIAFMMDCDTTGIEPAIALVSYKKLVGGGSMKIVNNIVSVALGKVNQMLSGVEGEEILQYIKKHDTIEGAPHLKPNDLEVFDCAFKPANGARSIAPMGHVRMMAAVQPYLSGAISKTVNMPESATVEDIEKVYIDAWKMGLKAIAIYRDGCKRSQPLNTSDTSAAKTEKSEPNVTPVEPITLQKIRDLAQKDVTPSRRRLPDTRQSITHRFSIGGEHEGYINAGMYEDGDLGEVFVHMSKEGSMISGLVDTIAILTSLALQHGVPLEALVKKFEGARFAPDGWTGNAEIPYAKSLVDYVFRWLGNRFLNKATDSKEISHSVNVLSEPSSVGRPTLSKVKARTSDVTSDAPSCGTCGTVMIRAGACYLCSNCGTTSSCG